MARRSLLLGLPLIFAPVLFAQDQGKQDKKGEVVTLKITIGERPPGSPPNPYLMKYDPKDPLELSGKAVPEKEFAEAVREGLDYVLEQQDEDGGWTYRSSQLRKQSRFAQVAQQSCTRVVMTSLCGLALRGHEKTESEKVDAAVDRAVRFVAKHAPDIEPANYMIWTWAYALSFLSSEYEEIEDAKLKAEVREACEKLVERIVREQRPGELDAVELPARTEYPGEKDPAPSWEEEFRKSKGGLIGAAPVMEQKIRGGVLISRVSPGGPADKAGLKPGDRIFEVDGRQIWSVANLMDIIDALEPGSTVEMKVLRGAPKGGPTGKPSDGGWSYYTFSESMTFTTATTLLALHDAESMGIDVPDAAIERGSQYLLGTRFRHEAQSEDGFSYRAGIRRGGGADIRGAIGRTCVCTMALVRGGHLKQTDVKNAVGSFVRRRGELDRVRDYPGNHCVRLFANAAYYFLYGHYYAAVAVNALEDKAARTKAANTIASALIRTRHEDGTWTDHEGWGRLYGTAMALMALGELYPLTAKEAVPSHAGREY